MIKHQRLSFENFYGILEYNEDDIDNWLVDYSVKNKDIEEALRNISIHLRDLESEIFNIKYGMKSTWHQ